MTAKGEGAEVEGCMSTKVDIHIHIKTTNPSVDCRETVKYACG